MPGISHISGLGADEHIEQSICLIALTPQAQRINDAITRGTLHYQAIGVGLLSVNED